MPPNSDVRPITANFPATLAKWRDYNTSPRRCLERICLRRKACISLTIYGCETADERA
jgi:hypothetical protein